MSKTGLLHQPPPVGAYHTIVDPSIIPIQSPVFRSSALTSNAKIVFTGLQVLMGRGEFGLDEIVETCGLAPAACQDAVRELMEFGLIEYDEAAGTLGIVNRHPIFIEGYLPKE